MMFSNEKIEEFKSGALDLLDKVECRLPSQKIGGDFATLCDADFRAFHRLRSSAGILSWIESHCEQHNPRASLFKDNVSCNSNREAATQQPLVGKNLSFEYKYPKNLPAKEITAPLKERALMPTLDLKAVTQSSKTPGPFPKDAPKIAPYSGMIQQMQENFGTIYSHDHR